MHGEYKTVIWTCGRAAEPSVQLPGCPQRLYLTKGGKMVGRSDCVRRDGGKVWEGSKTLVFGETLTYTNTVRGVLVSYKQSDMGAGRRG